VHCFVCSSIYSFWFYLLTFLHIRQKYEFLGKLLCTISMRYEYHII
jgi:hypothetical protein